MSKKEEKNNQIISAATEEFLEKGLDAASMHNIAQRAEVSKRTLYRYYPSKEDLYSALIDKVLGQIESIYSFDYEGQSDIRKEIEKIVDAKIKYTLSDTFLRINKILIGEMLKGRRPTEEQFNRLNKSESIFVDWIKEGQKQKRIKSNIDAKKIAEQFHSILKGQIYWPVLLGLQSQKDLNIESVRQSTVGFFLSSFVE